MEFRRVLFRSVGVAEAAAIVSFLAPVFGGAAGFLRVLRTVRFLHSYQVVRRLRTDFPLVRRHQDLLAAILHLAVFLFVTTGLVYETQGWRNDQINNYVDALYFTVTALTTTGFGDITLEGTGGRLLAVLIMIFGVTLFRSEEHTSELQSLMRISYAVFCLKKKKETPLERIHLP